MEDAVVPNYENDDDDSLASDIDPFPPPNDILETEGLDSETEGVDSYNDGVENEVITPDKKIYILRNPPVSTTVTKDPIGAPWDGKI